MARPKTAADERYNQRRRLERRSLRLMQQGRESEAREVYAEAQQFRANVTRIVAPKNKSARRMAIFKQQLNTAGEVGSQYSDVRRKSFFAATKQIWQGREGDRLGSIQKYFYRSNTPESRDFKMWAKAQGADLREQSLFYIEQYIAYVNSKVIEQSESVSAGSPRAFERLITFG